MAILQLVAVLAALLGLIVSAEAQYSSWQSGRATFYGVDAWNIHQGSCGYGWLDKKVATGWNIAAIADVAHDAKGSCGKCKEVRCRPSSFADGYGQWLDRTKTCYNDYSSVVVMITDRCDCQYPTNYFSNKRWCCGDMYHLDLSVWAYERLAQKKWGVIGISWRDVPCWHKPKNQAKAPWWAGPTVAPYWYKQPWGWNKYMDKRFDPRSRNTGGSGK